MKITLRNTPKAEWCLIPATLKIGQLRAYGFVTAHDVQPNLSFWGLQWGKNAFGLRRWKKVDT